MPATTTKRRSQPSINRIPAQELIERELNNTDQLDEAFDEMMTQIVNEHEGDLSLGTIHLSRGQMLVFERMGVRGPAEISRTLTHHKKTLDLREAFGDPSILAKAREELASREDELNSTAARVEDLATHGGGTPVMKAQIQKLGELLQDLTAVRDMAKGRVEEIEMGRKQLAEHAPKWLKEKVRREINAEKWNHRAYTEPDKLRPRIEAGEKALLYWETSTQRAPERPEVQPQPWPLAFQLVQYASHYLPSAIVKGRNGGKDSVDVHEFARHIDQLKSVELPRLRAERDLLKSEWLQTVDGISAPIARWVETGYVD